MSDDVCFFFGDFGDIGIEIVDVINVDWGDDGDWCVDYVGGVLMFVYVYFDYCYVDGCVCKGCECYCGEYFEFVYCWVIFICRSL